MFSELSNVSHTNAMVDENEQISRMMAEYEVEGEELVE